VIKSDMHVPDPGLLGVSVTRGVIAPIDDAVWVDLSFA